MALLTADDVLNKKFQSVKFREGYDQIEVDEFLDEVVATIYSLSVENNELKEQLGAAEERIEQLSSGSPVAAVEPVVEPAAAPEVEAEVEVAPVVEEEVVEQLSVPEPAADPQAATSMLALAQRLHDEYVQDGRSEADRIIAEAQQEGTQIVAEANTKRDDILQQLAQEQTGLEESINHLREFEGDYRKAISEHLQSLLEEVKPAAEQQQ